MDAMKASLLFCALSLLACPTVAWKAAASAPCDFNLSPGNGTDGSRFMQAIAQQQTSGKTSCSICLSPGVFVFDVVVCVPQSFSLTVVGTAATTELQGTKSGVIFNATINSLLQISSVTITGCAATAVIGTSMQSFVASGVVFTDNTCALSITAATATMSNCTVTRSRQPSGTMTAAAVITASESIVIQSCNFTNNIGGADDQSAGVGAGLALQGTLFDSNALVQDSMFSNNSAAGGAAGLYAQNLSLVLHGNVFSNNSISPDIAVWGAALTFSGPTLDIIHSQFYSNHAPCGAAAIAASATAAFNVYDSTFAANACDSQCNTMYPVNATIVYLTGSFSPTVDADCQFVANTVAGSPTCPNVANSSMLPRIPPAWPTFTTNSQAGWRATPNKCKQRGPSGTLRWKYATTEELSGPVIGKDNIVCAAAADSVYAWNTEGALIWHFTGGGSSFAPVFGVGDLEDFLFVSGDQCTFALDRTTGALKWNLSYPPDSWGQGLPHPWTVASPTLGEDGAVFILIGQPPGGSFAGGFAVALWGQTGVFRWVGTIGQKPASRNGATVAKSASGLPMLFTLVCSQGDWSIHALNCSNGDQLWYLPFDISYGGQGTPAVHSGVIYAMAQDDSTSDPHIKQVPTLHAVRLEDGVLLWKLSLGGGEDSSPAVTSDGTVLVTGGSCLFAIRAPGTIVWVWNATSQDGASPAISEQDGVVYVREAGNTIAAVDLASGRLRWRSASFGAQDFGAVGDIAIGADGALYVCSTVGISVFEC